MPVRLNGSTSGYIDVAATPVAGTTTITLPATTGTAVVADGSGNISVSGSITDGIGNVRTIPINSQTSAYVLVATDNGKFISITTGGVTVNSGIFTAGQNIVIFNNSSSAQTITQGTSVTMYQSGTTNTGNRTLAAYGVATILCVASNTFVISGSGLS